jgi:hypothetical protein
MTPDKHETRVCEGAGHSGKRPAAFNRENVRRQPPAMTCRTSPDMSGDVRECPGADEAPLDPAAAYRRRSERAAAWAAWEAAGEPWPPPAGLVSAALDRCQTNSSDRRWRR